MTFDRTDSTLGRLGVNFGAAFQAGERLILAPFGTLSVWREFGRPSTAHVFINSAGQTFDVATQRVGTFGQAGVGVQFKVLNSPLLGFVRGDVRFGQRIEGKALNAGVRLQF